MNTILKTSIAILTCLATSSCSLFSSSTELITIEASNPKATIRVNGQAVGVGSVATPLKKNKSHAITADYGNERGMAVIDSHMSTTGKLDIVGGIFFLLPFLGFINEGAWELDPDYVRIDMR